MRFPASLSLLALISSITLGTFATPTGTSECGPAEYCPSYFENVGATSPSDPVRRSLPSTNAERLARNLPIKPPTRRMRESARRSQPSSVPQVTMRGIIKVSDSTTSETLGYISKNTFSKAQYRYQPSLDDALIVNINVNYGTNSISDARIMAENSDMDGLPLLGLIQGRDSTTADMSHESYNYAYIGGMALPGTSPNSLPLTSPENSYTRATGTSRSAASDVWNVDFTTGALTMSWVNQDGSKPNIERFVQSTALYIGGDRDAFVSRFPSPATLVSYTFISI